MVAGASCGQIRQTECVGVVFGTSAQANASIGGGGQQQYGGADKPPSQKAAPVPAAPCALPAGATRALRQRRRARAAVRRAAVRSASRPVASCRGPRGPGDYARRASRRWRSAWRFSTGRGRARRGGGFPPPRSPATGYAASAGTATSTASRRSLSAGPPPRSTRRSRPPRRGPCLPPRKAGGSCTSNDFAGRRRLKQVRAPTAPSDHTVAMTAGNRTGNSHAEEKENRGTPRCFTSHAAYSLGAILSNSQSSGPAQLRFPPGQALTTSGWLGPARKTDGQLEGLRQLPVGERREGRITAQRRDCLAQSRKLKSVEIEPPPSSGQGFVGAIGVHKIAFTTAFTTSRKSGGWMRGHGSIEKPKKSPQNQGLSPRVREKGKWVRRAESTCEPDALPTEPRPHKRNRPSIME